MYFLTNCLFYNLFLIENCLCFTVLILPIRGALHLTVISKSCSTFIQWTIRGLIREYVAQCSREFGIFLLHLYCLSLTYFGVVRMIRANYRLSALILGGPNNGHREGTKISGNHQNFITILHIHMLIQNS